MVISDTDAIYLYGLDIIAEKLAQSDRYYYMHDGLGSVRQLLDNTGQIETTYAYDPFGVPLSSGSVANPYRYTGDAWDAEVELLYLRARYYQPATGRFVTKDPWPGDIRAPGTLNAYTYVQNNATSYVDPTGLDGWGPGGLFPEMDRGPARPELGEYLLIAFVPHEVLLGRHPDPYVTYQEMLLYSQTGYSPRASLGLAELLLLSWFFPVGGEEYHFGPNSSLTKDVMNDPAVQWFKDEWRRAGHPLPFSRPHEADPRGGTWTERAIGWGMLVRENYELGMCVLGRGSETAEGRIDPVGAVLGSFDLIRVEKAGVGAVKFVVYNRMTRASVSRSPGTDESRWKPVPRGDVNWLTGNWWGTTVHQYFYWRESDPLGGARLGEP
ncbi:MAG: RHS repeat-associated core domain-containing protein [Anaerolineae bacterium]